MEINDKDFDEVRAMVYKITMELRELDKLIDYYREKNKVKTELLHDKLARGIG